MPAPSSIITAAGELLALLREQPAVSAPHHALLAELVTDLDGAPVVISADGFGLAVDEHRLAAGVPGAEALFDAMSRHRIGRIELEGGAPSTGIMALLRALATDPAPGATATEVAAQAGLAPGGPIRLAGPPSLPLASDTLTLETLDRQGRESPADAASLDPFPDLDTIDAGPAREAAPAPAIERTPSPFLQLPLAEALARLERAPGDEDAGALLHHVTLLARQLADAGRWDDLLATGGALLRAESAAGTAAVARRYDSALRRMLTRPVLEALVPLVVTGPYRAEGFPVFRRGGADATDVLLERLVEAPDMDERAAAFRAMQEMTEGTHAVVHLLTHDAWYVLRNVAELCGLMRLEAAAPRLRLLLGHADERVRRAAAGALPRLSGSEALEGTRRALRDPSPLVRLAAAQAIGEPASRSLVMPLVGLLDEESNPDVLRELHLALGRIGTPEAVQVLARAAEPGGLLLNRKATVTRLAAVEGLRLAGGPAAERMLLALASDPDRTVGAAASAALDAAPG